MKTTIDRMVACVVLALLAACGGGGGGAGSSDTVAGSSASQPTVPPESVPASSPTAAASIPAASSNPVVSRDPSALPVANAAANVVPVVVAPGAWGVRDYPMVSVTVCAPQSNATKNCSTIDNVLLDTESFGLRLFASAVPAATLATFTPQLHAATGVPLVECGIFGSGYSWGTVRNADIRLSAEVAQAVPIQLMSDPSLLQSAPTDCQQNTALSGPSVFGANGILGVGVSRRDCGQQCANAAVDGFYYTCNGAMCSAVAVPLNQQVANPVQFFSTDNNGVVVELPPVAADGAQSVSGALVFGIDTQPNNMLSGSGAVVLTTNSYGDFNGTYEGTTFGGSAFIDSGSTDLYFNDPNIAMNGLLFYIPSSTVSRSVTISGYNLTSAVIEFNIGNASSLLATGNFAFDDIGHYLSFQFDLGLPFFFGRHVYYGIADAPSGNGTTGPYVAFTSS